MATGLRQDLIALASEYSTVTPDETIGTDEMLDTLNRIRLQLDDLIGEIVERARKNGTSWSEIGRRLGTTKQGAQQRYGRHG